MGGQTTKTDRYTDSQWSIAVEHGLIHDDRMWSSVFPTTNIAAAGVTNFILICHDYDVHFTYRVETDKASLVDVYEDPTVTVNGAAMAVLNVKRDSAAATGVLCYSGSTVTVNGTLLDPHILGDAVGGGKSGEEQRSHTEWVAEAGHTYLSQVTTLGVNTRINMAWRFYEEL